MNQSIQILFEKETPLTQPACPALVLSHPKFAREFNIRQRKDDTRQQKIEGIIKYKSRINRENLENELCHELQTGRDKAPCGVTNVRIHLRCGHLAPTLSNI